MLSESLLQKAGIMVVSQLGLDFPQNKWKDLERGILSAARELGKGDTEQNISDWLSNGFFNPGDLEVLINYLTVGETFFFREKPGLDAFKHHIIPDIVHERQGKEQYLRIWSAGCCTGEEPYTLAILLTEIIPDITRWNISLLATDTNPTFLSKAQAGVYSAWSFRETDPTVREKYFIPADKNWEIVPQIRNMVTFSLLNLATDDYPSIKSNTHAMDVIFCRNVLMYFTPNQIKLTGKRFFQSLNEKGWFIPGSVELNDACFDDFTSLKVENGIFYRKLPKVEMMRAIPVIDNNIAKHPAKKQPARQTDFKQNLKQKEKTVNLKSSTDHQFSIPEITQLYNKGAYRQCIENCLSALKKATSDSNVITLLIKSYANLGKLEEALEWGDKLLEMNNAGAESFYLYATILMEKNEQERAETALKRALYHDPHHILSHLLQGNIAKRKGDHRIAQKHFKNAKDLLAAFNDEDIVPGSEGLTAGRLKELKELLS